MSNKSEIVIERLSNGLVVIVEKMQDVQSVAYDLSIPGGLIHEDPSSVGSVLVLAELISRGAGDYNAREISDAFENIGARHSESASSDSFSFRGLCLSPDFADSLRLTALQVLKPRLPEEEIAAIQSLLIQDINSLPDNPSRRVIEELHRNYLPAPYNRSNFGTVQGINSVTQKSSVELHRKMFSPQGSILSIAGHVDPVEALKTAKELFGNWQGSKLEEPEFAAVNCPGSSHIQSDSAQLQITLAYPSVKHGDKHYYSAKVASAILSGGMFGRLFVEVREKRGLVYSVSARHVADKVSGYFMAYAGTTADRAQETLDVLISELKNMSNNIEPLELKRAKTHIKSALVMSDESSSSRAISNASDYWILGKIREFDEIMSEINSVDEKSIKELSQSFPADDYYLATLGSKQLKI